MNVDQFVAKYNGVHIDEDGYYGAQCWDVSARYAREVVGCPSFPTGSGGAEGLFRIFANPIPQYFDRIANNKSDPSQIPQKGDVIVWDSSFSPPWGHTALVISANSAGVTVLEQNGNNPGGVSYIKTRGWTGVSGWLRPKNKGVENMIIPDADNWYNRFRRLMIQIRGRDLSREEFRKNFVGVEVFRMIEVLSDDKEADMATDWQNWGKIAKTDNWQGQIYGLQDTVKARDGVISQNNADLVTLRNQVAELDKRPTQTQLDEIKNTISEAEKRAMEAQAEAEKSRVELDKYKTEDKATENAVLKWLKAIFKLGNKE